MSVADDVGLEGALENRRIAEMRRCLGEHKARLNRLIVQGLPTQEMEDSLRKLEAGLRALQERHRSPAHRETLLESGLPRAASREPASPQRSAPPSRPSQRAA